MKRRQPEVYKVVRRTPARVVPPPPESGVMLVGESQRRGWVGLRGSVEHEFRGYGEVDNGDPLTDARGRRRAAG